MFAIFNRFDPRYEEVARDLGASPWQTLRHVVLPIIGPSVVGIGLFGFTLSWGEIARTSQAIGDRNTLPLELQGQTTTVTTPVIYALGTLTTAISFAVIASACSPSTSCVDTAARAAGEPGAGGCATTLARRRGGRQGPARAPWSPSPWPVRTNPAAPCAG
jgi:putative spermidine/putrescine transport system permease protein